MRCLRCHEDVAFRLSPLSPVPDAVVCKACATALPTREAADENPIAGVYREVELAELSQDGVLALVRVGRW